MKQDIDINFTDKELAVLIKIITQEAKSVNKMKTLFEGPDKYIPDIDYELLLKRLKKRLALRRSKPE